MLIYHCFCANCDVMVYFRRMSYDVIKSYVTVSLLLNIDLAVHEIHGLKAPTISSKYL